MAEVLRADPGTRGLCSGNGGFLAKHAFGVYSSEPPEAGYRWESTQEEVDALPRRDAVDDHEGAATLESYTLMFGAGGPERAIAALLLGDGRRTWTTSDDVDLALAMTQEEPCGRAAKIDGAGTFRLL
jgi:acetyl-CoA C-acetyltransferase